jgi:hypothetical protein
MSEKSVVPGEKEITDSYVSGRLVSDIFDRFGYVDEPAFNSILSLCVKLHNVGAIDLLSLTKTSEFERIDGSRFFLGQHFFCEAIPRLNDSTREMMHCVRALVEKGGTDLAANQPNAAFAEWCKADLVRAQEVLHAAREDDPLANEFLTFALTAGNMVEEAKDFVARYVGVRRLSGIAALGRMIYADPGTGRGDLSTLLCALDGKPDDPLFANILASALDIAEKTDQIACDEALSIIKRVCAAPGPHTHLSCARVLWLHHKSLTEEVVVLLLQALNSVDPTHKGTIQALDQGLRRLLDTSYDDHGIAFVEKLLSSNNTLALSDFPDFSRRLIEGPAERFHRVFVAWMLSGKRVLCEGMSDFFRRGDRDDVPLSLPLQGLSPVKQIFLCRKAIGYLFLQPVTAASILVSVLRACNDAVADQVSSLLFDPLLLSYGGATTNYLGGIGTNDPAHAHVHVALKQRERYLEALKSAGTIKELHPSERERQLEHLRFHDQMRTAHKEAEKKSVFLNLVTRSVILYGKRSTIYVEGPDDTRKPVDMELKEYSVAFELPRMEIVDPNGLDYMLRVFRAERLKS